MRMDFSSNLITGLKAFGLDGKEARLYLAGLRLGPATIIELAHQAKLPRTTVYSILEKMTNDNLFHLGKKKKHTVYTAESPQNLEKKFQEKQISFQKITPELLEIHEICAGSPNITIYEGTDGFKQMWKDLFLSDTKEYRMITGGMGMLEYVHKPYLIKRIIAERVRRNIKSYQLIIDSRYAREIIAKDAKELRESRLLPTNSQIPATIIVFDNKIAYLTTRRENIMILLASGDVAITFRTMFDLMWKCAENPKVE
jgi:sugar-specific transcriptional regulator TrmB